MVGTSKLEQRRRARVRRQIRKSANGRPRLSVFRSNKYIYAQVIDDLSGKTVAAASSREESVAAGANQEAAAEVGKLVHWEHFEDFVKAVKSQDYTLAKGYVGKDCEEGRYLARASCNFLQTVGHESSGARCEF